MTKPGISAERVEELKQYLDASWHSALAVLGVNHPDGQRLGQIHCDLLACLCDRIQTLQALKARLSAPAKEGK